MVHSGHFQQPVIPLYPRNAVVNRYRGFDTNQTPGNPGSTRSNCADWRDRNPDASPEAEAA
jgi:hypothetical protein